MKVLIVDDNSDDRSVLKYTFINHDWEVIEASNGIEGLIAAGMNKPDLIISDALMPKMDGYQFLRKIKGDENLKAIPFIFYSAVYTAYKEAELAISLGAEAFIKKPETPDGLWGKIMDIFNRTGQGKRPFKTKLIEEEQEFLEKYSHIVAAKLEEKVRELEKAKAEVEAREQEWQTTFDSIGDCVTIHDRDFNVLLANKSCEKVLGASQNEIRSRKCFELFHGKARPHEACPKLNTEQTGNPFETEIFEPKLNCWLSIACFPLLNKDGAVRGVVHFARDITQRKETDKDLVESVARFRATFEQAAVGIAHVAPDGHWLRVNQKLCDIVGYAREELLTKTFQDITHPDDLKSDMDYVRLMLAGQIKTYSIEKRYIRKDGAFVWINLTVSLVRNDLGQPKYFISVIEDITERKSLESQLRQAQKMEAVGQLAGGIAHDFNNIMSAIINYAYLIKNRMNDDDPLRDQIEHISSLSMKASGITRGLLAFSRKNIVNLMPVHVNNVLHDMGKLLSKFIGEDIQITFRLSDRDLIIMADGAHIEQIIINIATNARDAMPEGGSLTLETDLVSIDDDFIRMHGFGTRGAYALLSVTDTGIGMNEETKQKIFEPFFTTKEVGKGTGLGLAIIYGIVKQHEGYISVYSEPGMGTTFKIYFHLANAAVPEKEESKQSDLTGHAETILLAEDEEAVRKSTKIILEQFGYRVIEAVNGDDAIAKYREHKDKIDLLLFDVIMPKKNGKEAYEEIKKITPGVKVIFTSGYSADIIDKKGIIKDGFTHILKPLSPDKLLSTIKEVLQSGKESPQ